jgi:hypothetical protein
MLSRSRSISATIDAHADQAGFQHAPRRGGQHRRVAETSLVRGASAPRACRRSGRPSIRAVRIEGLQRVRWRWDLNSIRAISRIRTTSRTIALTSCFNTRRSRRISQGLAKLWAKCGQSEPPNGTRRSAPVGRATPDPPRPKALVAKQHQGEARLGGGRAAADETTAPSF